MDRVDLLKFKERKESELQVAKKIRVKNEIQSLEMECIDAKINLLEFQLDAEPENHKIRRELSILQLHWTMKYGNEAAQKEFLKIIQKIEQIHRKMKIKEKLLNDPNSAWKIIGGGKGVRDD